MGQFILAIYLQTRRSHLPPNTHTHTPTQAKQASVFTLPLSGLHSKGPW